MDRYFVTDSAQPNGVHEVHRAGCDWLPNPENRTPLGDHAICRTAVAAAGRVYPGANGCHHRSRDCHTG